MTSIGIVPRKNVVPIFSPVEAPTYHLLHPQTFDICERLAYSLLVDVLVSIHAHNESVSSFSPFLELFEQVVSNPSSRACTILLLFDLLSSMLLIRQPCCLTWVLHGSYLHTTCFVVPSLPLRVSVSHLPRPVSSFLEASKSHWSSKVPYKRRLVPPCCVLPTFAC